MNVLFLVLARGGSKGLPGKNIKELAGKPLIGYTIETALSSEFCTRVVVSTDDADIASVAMSFGAEVPFMRPHELASDNAKSIDAILHAIDFLEQRGEHYDLLVLLEPTSPIREVADIDAAIKSLVADKTAKSLVSVTPNESAHPDFLFTADEHGLLNSYSTAENVVRRQDLKTLFYPEGSFYMAHIKNVKECRTFYIDNFTLGYCLPKWKSFEIDTPEDFIIVESILLANFAGKFNAIK